MGKYLSLPEKARWPYLTWISTLNMAGPIPRNRWVRFPSNNNIGCVRGFTGNIIVIYNVSDPRNKWVNIAFTGIKHSIWLTFRILENATLLAIIAEYGVLIREWGGLYYALLEVPPK